MRTRIFSRHFRAAAAIGWIILCEVALAGTVVERPAADMSRATGPGLPAGDRIRIAAVFGENELGQMADRFGTPNQCYSTLVEEEPPTGRFVHIGPDGRESQLGTGHTVHAADVAITASHFLRYSNGRKIPPERLVFRVFEGTPATCREVDYPVSALEHGAEDIDTDISNDFAIVRLSRPLTAYIPLELADTELVEDARIGRENLVLMGFPKHEATRNDQNYSAVTCRGQAPSPRNIYFRNPYVFIHDCDSTKGSSGGAFTVIRAAQSKLTPSGKARKYSRYFVGLQQGHASQSGVDPDRPSRFSPDANFNAGIALSPKMRSMIEAAAGF